jgi:hypothetical protein
MKIVFGEIDATAALGDEGFGLAEFAECGIQLGACARGDPDARYGGFREGVEELRETGKRFARGRDEIIDRTENDAGGRAQEKAPGLGKL